ncbi:MAG: VWA domain-containing protein [Firmicutes bacterium]|nr:VWA domain-containing protein [Bacillota bacterium]
MTNRQEVYYALRAVLCGQPEDFPLFDMLFSTLFVNKGQGEGSSGDVSNADLLQETEPMESGRPDEGREVASQGAKPRAAEREATENAELQGAVPFSIREGTASENEPSAMLGVRFSPESPQQRSAAAVSGKDLDQMRQTAQALVASVRLGKSRRWQVMENGGRFDFRRTLRQGLQAGGEFGIPKWQGHPQRRPRFVLLCDSSRSMASYSQLWLQLGFELLQQSQRVEVFLFSTELRRVTNDLKVSPGGALPVLRDLGAEWGGGTRIGACLEHFVRSYGLRLLDQDTVVFIASDGLDTGDIERLRWAMRELHRRSAGVIWLNPLLGTPGYVPRARGMHTALPYIDTFADAHDAASIRKLARHLRLRR